MIKTYRELVEYVDSYDDRIIDAELLGAVEESDIDLSGNIFRRVDVILDLFIQNQIRLIAEHFNMSVKGMESDFNNFHLSFTNLKDNLTLLSKLSTGKLVSDENKTRLMQYIKLYANSIQSTLENNLPDELLAMVKEINVGGINEL